jgi:hypothetical protein
VQRMKQCDNILGLSAELRVYRRLMYKWCDRFDPVDKGEELPAPLNLRESRLHKEVNQLKWVLADKTLELDFLKVPCRKHVATRSRCPRTPEPRLDRILCTY